MVGSANVVLAQRGRPGCARLRQRSAPRTPPSAPRGSPLCVRRGAAPTRAAASDDGAASAASAADEVADYGGVEMDIEAQAEEFMRMQAMEETGQGEAAPPPGGFPEAAAEASTAVVGATEVADADVDGLRQSILDSLAALKKDRDMTLNEVRLIIAIEDPRMAQNRQMYNVEVSTRIRTHPPSLPSCLPGPACSSAAQGASHDDPSYHQIPNPLCVEYLPIFSLV